VGIAAMGAIVGVAVLLALALFGGEEPARALVPRTEQLEADPFVYDASQDDELVEQATFALSQPLYAKSPGGVFATARRTEAFRSQIESAVDGSGLDPDLLEAIVFLESGGRPDVIAGDDPVNASGLTQILAETAENFLGMFVDLDMSRALTVEIADAVRNGNLARAERLRERRREIDARFDPRSALAGTVRYLTTARDRLGRDDLAVVSYHMGIGNLTNVLLAYTGAEPGTDIPALVEANELSWVRVFFDTAPDRNARAHRLLARFGDDSPTYYWRVLAAREIMRLYREDPDRLQELDLLHTSKASAEEVLHPPSETERFADASDLQRAWDARTLHPLPDAPARLGFAIDPGMGELAARLGQPRELYRGLRAESLALLVYMARRVKELSGAKQPLRVTSTLRDEEYQGLLRNDNPEAAHGYSLHTTGYAFDVARRYESGRQAQAFQFLLDDLTARGLIAWIREQAAIHITVAGEAEELVPLVLERERER
jgi:soluble lytic murein transglycosylase-like protein